MAKNRFCHNESELYQSLSKWYRTVPGEYLLQAEWAILERLVEEVFGYQLLQVGLLGDRQHHLGSCRIQNQSVLTGEAEVSLGLTEKQNQVSGRFDHLPVASDTVDAVLLPHSLDFSSDPHSVIREAERVLIPEGHLIITAFNPWSLWGLWRLFHLRSGSVPWCGQFVSASRVTDWLRLLGFDIVKREAMLFKPPIKQKKILASLNALDNLGHKYWPLLGGVYVIQAIKRVTPLTPRRQLWKLHHPGLRGHVVEPSARSSGRFVRE